MRWVWTGLTTLLVLGAVGAAYLQWKPAEEAAGLVDGAAFVTDEARYYVMLPVVEAAPAKASGKRWDLDGSAPDLYYEIHWQGHRVFRSRKKQDTLLAKWSNTSVNLKDLVGSVSVDDALQGARITARAGDAVEFVVFDADLASPDDEVGRWSVPVGDLAVGEQTWTSPGGALVTVVCRVVALDDVDLATLTK